MVGTKASSSCRPSSQASFILTTCMNSSKLSQRSKEETQHWTDTMGNSTHREYHTQGLVCPPPPILAETLFLIHPETPYIPWVALTTKNIAELWQSSPKKSLWSSESTSGKFSQLYHRLPEQFVAAQKHLQCSCLGQGH